MILSPLEQFNILSLIDFNLAGGFEIFYSSFLFWIWSLLYIYPVSLISFVLNKDIVGLSIITSILLEFYQFFLTNFFYIFSHFVSAFLFMLQCDKLFNLIDFFYTFYNSCLSYIWLVCYKNLDIFYSINNFSFLISFYDILFYNDTISTLNNTNLSVDTISSLTKSNISLISSSWGLFLVNIYSIFFEIFVSIKLFFYQLFIANILNLSLCNFSYLIFSLNTSTVFQILGVSLISLLFLTITWKNSITLVAQNRWQTLLEMFYQVILNVVNENAGPKGKKFFPLIFTTFVIILTRNVLGMIPYSFTVTSHLIVTFTTALAIFTGMNILGILKHGKHFLSLFFPPGAPLALAPLLVLIEFISYIFRVLSLSIRLFANLMSGHTLLKILASFSWGVVSLWGIFLLPVLIIFIVTGLEMAIAFLQAYIFAVLLCIYSNDAFNLH